ncbi:type IV toxin-antitoxin system AbiEi family antitoxin [Paractinoplanes durhamensis]|uniref:MarR family transcriptional regulator n=1 Tax=Paractinoplanes durhamensis TaxID=113563 RepID=A0ABQ3YYB1_9ACTN|nr:type IV toxin-antitoxin system AbiEi family antitoxin [Actinoplanes durhamensis]GIE02588.1 hypothetical protein Adu01nite_39380 [Actinoplanes durhamensis]
MGNAFILFDGVRIEVQGRTAPTKHTAKDNPPAAPPTRRTNLFSSGRSRVIFALLAWPELAGGKIREIATAAGIPVGQAHDALTRLEEAGYLIRASRAMTREDDLLDFWAAAYPAGLGRRLEIARYHGDPVKPINSRTWKAHQAESDHS